MLSTPFVIVTLSSEFLPKTYALLPIPKSLAHANSSPVNSLVYTNSPFFTVNLPGYFSEPFKSL